MVILGIDPGTKSSAFVRFDGTTSRVVECGHLDNNAMASVLAADKRSVIAIEQIEAMGMAVGREVFETVRWTGHFEGRLWPEPVYWVTRRDVKLHLCGSMKAKDPNIRQALLDRFGGSTAVGTKKMPGPLYGVSKHAWSALAVAVTFWDTRTENGEVVLTGSAPEPTKEARGSTDLF